MPPSIVAVYGSSNARPGDGHYEEGLRIGKLLVEAGFGVATGGYGGLMEAVSAGARRSGGEAIGITAPTIFESRDGANPHLTREHAAPSLTERIHELNAVAVAAIALGGSIGTFTELMVAWNVAFVSRFSSDPPKPVIAVGSQWKEMLPRLATSLGTDLDPVICVDTVDEAVAVVKERVGGGAGTTV